jgi:hypothetical protein
MNNARISPTLPTDLFAKTSVPRSVRSMTLDLVIPAAGFAIGTALFTACWKLGLWHSTLGIVFASLFLVGLPILAFVHTVVDVIRGKGGTQSDFVLFATFGYLSTYALGMLTL